MCWLTNWTFNIFVATANGWFLQRFLTGGPSSKTSEADQRLLRASSFTLRFSGCVWGGAVARAVPSAAAGAECLRATSDTQRSPTCSLCTRSPYRNRVRSGLHDAQPRPYTKNGWSTVDSSSTWKYYFTKIIFKHNTLSLLFFCI